MLPPQVTARNPRGTRLKPLPLLPSGPDGVGGPPLRGTWLSLLTATVADAACTRTHRIVDKVQHEQRGVKGFLSVREEIDKGSDSP